MKETNVIEHAPLIRFSIYSHLQVKIIQSLGAKILEVLDNTFLDERIDGEAFTAIYGQFWLWILAAYEVSRTMSEYPRCFSERHNTEVTQFKRRVSVLRMPFAKLQLQGRDKQSINGEAS